MCEKPELPSGTTHFALTRDHERENYPQIFTHLHKLLMRH